MPRKMSGWVSGLILVCTLACLSGLAAGEERQYINHNYGFSFPLSEDMRLYTPDNPGPFTFEDSTIFILVNKWKPNELIMVNLSQVTDEKGLNDLKSELDSRGLPQPEYRKVSLQYSSIGANQRKQVVEHIFDMQGQVPRTMRQICFVHKGKGFAFVCTSNADRFRETNQTFFEPVFRSIKFE